MKSKCCRSLPRCASCPVLRVTRPKLPQPAETDLFALLRAGTPRRELPECVIDALESLDRRRFTREQRDVEPAGT